MQRLFVGSGINDGVECFLKRRFSRRDWVLVGIGFWFIAFFMPCGCAAFSIRDMSQGRLILRVHIHTDIELIAIPKKFYIGIPIT